MKVNNSFKFRRRQLLSFPKLTNLSPPDFCSADVQLNRHLGVVWETMKEISTFEQLAQGLWTFFFHIYSIWFRSSRQWKLLSCFGTSQTTWRRSSTDKQANTNMQQIFLHVLPLSAFLSTMCRVDIRHAPNCNRRIQTLMWSFGKDLRPMMCLPQ